MKQTLREGREGGRQRGLPWVILSCDILQGATPTPFSKPPPRHHPPIHLSHLFRDTFLSELWHSSTQFSTLHVIRLSIQITIPHCHLYPSLLPYSPLFPHVLWESIGEHCAVGTWENWSKSPPVISSSHLSISDSCEKTTFAIYVLSQGPHIYVFLSMPVCSYSEVWNREHNGRWQWSVCT